jgi:NAD(P)-dependent dehydrogenase (short-subunit alcohol dehydrogenase family)
MRHCITRSTVAQKAAAIGSSEQRMRIAISGVNRGIGEGLLRASLANGDVVVGLGRKAPDLTSDQAAAFRFVECDMADHEALAAACATIVDPIDVLICNAATFADGAGTIEWFHPDALGGAFAVNTIAPLVMARSLKPNLEKGSRRLIVMMSTGNASLAGNTTGSLLGYRVSKTALNQAVRTLAAEWGPHGYTIVALNPGWVKTDMGGPNAELSVEEATDQILTFVQDVSVQRPLNGCFVNADGSPLPW